MDEDIIRKIALSLDELLHFETSSCRAYIYSKLEKQREFYIYACYVLIKDSLFNLSDLNLLGVDDQLIYFKKPKYKYINKIEYLTNLFSEKEFKNALNIFRNTQDRNIIYDLIKSFNT